MVLFGPFTLQPFGEPLGLIGSPPVSNWEPMGRSGGALAPFGTSGDPPVALRLGLLLARRHVTDLANRTKHKTQSAILESSRAFLLCTCV